MIWYESLAYFISVIIIIVLLIWSAWRRAILPLLAALIIIVVLGASGIITGIELALLLFSSLVFSIPLIVAWIKNRGLE